MELMDELMEPLMSGCYISVNGYNNNRIWKPTSKQNNI